MPRASYCICCRLRRACRPAAHSARRGISAPSCDTFYYIWTLSWRRAPWQARAKAVKIVCIMGIDGAGKTTLARNTVAALRARGLDAAYFYGRQYSLFSRALLGGV